MTYHHFAPGSRNIKGFSLIELMVSITIGLVIMVASLSAYMGASGATRIAEAQGLMNEDAQAALTILTQQLRMAGNNHDQLNRIAYFPKVVDPDELDPLALSSSSKNSIYLPAKKYILYSSLELVELPTPLYEDVSLEAFELSEFRIRGCGGSFNSVRAKTYSDSLCAGVIDTLQNSIAINYEADIFNTIASDNLPTDCIGVKLNSIRGITQTIETDTELNLSEWPVVPVYYVADNRFYISESNGTPSLSCKGNGGAANTTAQPLVENIEDMKFVYGVMGGALEVEGYLDAAGVNGIPNSWNQVLTVRICIVVRSENQVVTDSSSANYRNCNGDDITPTDLRLRRAYTTTVVLRNRL